MKRTDKKSDAIRNFEEVISKFSENEILTITAMSFVRGGGTDGEGAGGAPVIIVPKF